jgi:hypothetical protein
VLGRLEMEKIIELIAMKRNTLKKQQYLGELPIKWQ